MEQSQEIKIPRAYSYNDIERRKFKILPLQGEWLRHLGDEVERTGSILIMGDSGHGKTTYAMKLMKALCKIEKVYYNTVEEGMKASFRRSLRLNGLQTVKSKFIFQSESYDEMVTRLKQKYQPKIVIIDSIQYCFRGKTKDDYLKLIEMFPDTLFIGISHIKKGQVIGAVAEEFYWLCQNRIYIEDFKAYIDKSRCGGDQKTPYIISQEKAAERELKLLKKG